MEMFDTELARLSRKGWQIVNRTETTAQVKIPKSFPVFASLVLVVLPVLFGWLWSFLYGIALVGLIIVVLDCLLQKERYVYITAEQLLKSDELIDA